VLGLVGIATDITERKREEEALRQSEENFKALAENANDGILIGTGEEGWHVYANRRAVEITGYPIEELLKTRIRDLAHPDELLKLTERHKKRLAGVEVPKPYETAIVNKDGIKVPIEISPSRTIWQNQLANIVILRDITERKRAEEILHFTRFALDNAVEAMVCLSQNARYIDANDTFCRSVGYSREELLSMTAHDIDPNYSAKIWPEFWEKLKQSGSLTFESYHCTKDGKVFPVEVTVTFFEYKGKEYHCGFARDITERKKIQQLLIQSEKMASIGILTAGIAHEINNPLGYIYSNLEMLLKYYEKGKIFYESIKKLIEEDTKDNTILGKFLELENNAKFETMFKDIKDSVEESIVGVKKVIKIITDLREFARDEKPKMELADINQGIENALNIVWNELKYKAEIIKEFGDIPQIQCDLYKLEQVFINMLINSAHAIENHGIIKIKTFSKNNFAIIQISDTGKGIPKENILRIFDPFYTTKAPGKGTGLGLSISYKIIEEHNGKIDVDSEISKGTTFTIRLPLKESKEFKEYKILIVDDDKNIRTLLKKMIYVYNPLILVKTAKDGFETADLLNTFMPDVIFLDIKMPGINGIEVCKRISSDKKMRNIKVVMITGFANEFSKEKCLKAGAIELLMKPIETKTLCEVLDKIIKE
jgi:PAS domain S-box-containing protein